MNFDKAEFWISYYFNGPVGPVEFMSPDSKLIVNPPPDDASQKTLTPLSDHIIVDQPTLTVTIGAVNAITTIDIKGATVTYMQTETYLIPGPPVSTNGAPPAAPTMVPVPNSALSYEVPIVIPKGFKGGAYTFTFTNLSPNQPVTFTVTDTSKKSDPTYQPEVDTVQVVATRSK
jgi:hypothetical protein